jgi:hypothetical protein
LYDKDRKRVGPTNASLPAAPAYFPFKDEAQTALFKAPGRTALETRFISVIKTNQFTL